MPIKEVTVDVSTWGPGAIDDLLAYVHKLESTNGPDSAPVSASTPRTKGGWSISALDELFNRLKVNNGAVQAEAIRAALDNGGEVKRSDVYKLGGYGADRSLKGFTRPVNRIFDRMKAEGLLPADAVHPFGPNYDETVAGYQRAPSFAVPSELVELWDGE